MKTLTLTRRLRLRAAGLLLMAPLLTAPSRGQARDQDVFAEVPAAARARLAERLRLLVEYQRTEQWAKLYNFLYRPTTSREKYVEQNARVAKDFGNTILDFEHQSATLLHHGGGWFFIKGCATQREKDGRVVTLEADVEARLEDGEWFLTPVGITIPIDGEPKPCSPQRTPGRPRGWAAARSPAHYSVMNGKRNKEGRRIHSEITARPKGSRN